jgi:hypothetical protein
MVIITVGLLLLLSTFERKLVIFLKRKMKNVAVETSPIGGV